MTIFSALKERVSTLDDDSRKSAVIILGAVLIGILAFALLHGHIARLEQRVTAREKALTELLSLRQRYQEATVDANRLKNRLALVTTEDSPATIIEQTGIVSKTGIQVKPLPRREKNGLFEENAEISISGISLNELIHLLHWLELHAKPVIVQKMTARPRFSEPAKLDVTFTLTLYRQAAASQQDQ